MAEAAEQSPWPRGALPGSPPATGASQRHRPLLRGRPPGPSAPRRRSGPARGGVSAQHLRLHRPPGCPGPRRACSGPRGCSSRLRVYTRSGRRHGQALGKHLEELWGGLPRRLGVRAGPWGTVARLGHTLATGAPGGRGSTEAALSLDPRSSSPSLSFQRSARVGGGDPEPVAAHAGEVAGGGVPTHRRVPACMAGWVQNSRSPEAATAASRPYSASGLPTARALLSPPPTDPSAPLVPSSNYGQRIPKPRRHGQRRPEEPPSLPAPAPHPRPTLGDAAGVHVFTATSSCCSSLRRHPLLPTLTTSNQRSQLCP